MYPIDDQTMQAILGQYQNPYAMPASPGGAMPQGWPAQAPPAPAQQPAIPGMDAAAVMAQGPTKDAAKLTKTPKDKSGGMWDAMLAALGSGLGGAHSQFPGYPGLHATAVGQGNPLHAPGALYGPTDFHSILAQLLKR